MLKYPVTFLLVYGAWILFTFSLNVQELVAGLLVSLVLAYITKDFLFHEKASKALNPLRWVRLIAYFFVWIGLEIWGNLDVGYRVITGRIKPAMVSVPTRFRTDIGKTLIGNSITLTPGTLTVKAGGTMMIHTIGYSKKKQIGKLFERFGIGVTE